MLTDKQDFYKFLAIYLILFLIIIQIANPNLRKDDFYIKYMHVSINKTNHIITESILYHVNSKHIHHLTKYYNGNISDVLNISCPPKFKVYERPRQKLIVGCKYNGDIAPGDYNITIKYKPKNVDFNYVIWIAFYNQSRQILDFTSNGEISFSKSLDGRPLIAFYPKEHLPETIYLYTLILCKNYGWIMFILSLFIIIFVYFKYGKDYTFTDVPPIYHVPPADRPAYDVAIFFRNPPDTKGIEYKIKGILSSIIMEALLQKAITIKENRLYIVGASSGKDGDIKIKSDSPINKFPYEIKQILTLLSSLKNIKNIPKQTHNLIVGYLILYYERKSKEYIDCIGQFIFGAAIVGLGLVFGLFMSLNISAYGILLPINTLSNMIILAYVVFGSILLPTAIKKHIFCRFKNREAYKEKLLWDAFANMLKNEALFKKYNPKSMNKWGKWLAYAYAYEIPLNKIVNKVENIGKIKYDKSVYLDISKRLISNEINQLHEENKDRIK